MQCFTMEEEDTAKFNSFQNALTPAKISKNDDRPNYEKITFTRIRSWDRNCLIAFVGIVLIAVVVTAVVVPVLLIEDTGRTIDVTTAPPTLEDNGAKQGYTEEKTTQHATTAVMDGLGTGEIHTTYAGDDNESTGDRSGSDKSTTTKADTSQPVPTLPITSDKTTEDNSVGEGSTTPQVNVTPGLSTKKSTTVAPDATTVKYGVEIRDDYSIENAGSWGAWSEYSSCTVSCGGGMRKRTRICETENNVECIGLGIQVETCNVTSCPPTVIYGTWTTWLAWGECSTTCGGGTRTRTRVCVKPSESALDCVGNQTQIKWCNTHQCPDCTMTCRSGSISEGCTYCICDEIYSGQIFSKDGYTVANVSISPATSPSEILYVTSIDGRYSLTEVCPTSEYLFNSEGYVDKSVSGSSLGGSQLLEKIGSLRIEKHPKNKYLVTGDPIILCCHATGSPAPEYYEWYKDGNVLFTLSDRGESQLQIANATSEDSGTYFCRANNGYSSIKSDVATVTVQASKTELCQSTPHSKITKLPDGCTWNGANHIDQGGCSQSPCRGNGSLPEMCGTSKDYCCSPISYARVDVSCSANLSIPILLVTSCGCSKCFEISRMLYGKVIGTDKTVRKYISVYFDGTRVARSQRDGTFTFKLPNDLTRLILTLRDEIYEEYMDTLYVVTISDESSENIYPTIRMVKKGAEIQISTNEESEIPVTSPESGKTIAEVIIPENSIYTTEGEPYSGAASVTIGVVDQNNTASLEAAPGDFSTINEEGDVETLQSAGMLAIGLKDETGNPLTIPGEITISVTSDQIGNVTTENGIADVKFWRLDSLTGSWEFTGYIIENEERTRMKRQVTGGSESQRAFTTTIRGISVETEWRNFDYVGGAICFSKIRLFGDSKFEETDQIPDASVGVIVEDISNNLRSLSRLRAQDDDYGGYCISHPCLNRDIPDGNTFTAYYYADYNGKEMKPATICTGIEGSIRNRIGYEVQENAIKVTEVNVQSTQTGPYYDFDRNRDGFSKFSYSPTCSRATFTENHFRFYDDSGCFQAYTALQAPINGENCVRDNFILWHSPSTYFWSPFDQQFRYRVCFIKIGLESVSPLPMKIRVISKEKIPRTDPSTRNIFGTRDGCNTEMQSTICLEIKDPSRIGCRQDGIGDITDSFITVKIEGINTERYRASEISDDLNEHHRSYIEWLTNSVTIDVSAGSDYGPNYGIYCSKNDDEDKDASYNTAKGNCESSDGGWAVKFTDNCMFKLDVIFVVDNSNSMRTPWDQVKCAMHYVTENTLIGEDFVQVALVTYEAGNSLQWNLGDPVSYNKDTLKTTFASISHTDSLATPAEALGVVSSSILGTAVDRSDAANIVIIISDGDEPGNGLLSLGNEIQQQARLFIIGTDEAAVNQLQDDLNVQESENLYYLSGTTGSAIAQRLENIACET